MSGQSGTHTFVLADLAGYTALTEGTGTSKLPTRLPSSAGPCACCCQSTTPKR
jgi:hypothetical protein